MAGAGGSALEALRGKCTVAGTLLVLVIALLAFAPPADAITRDAAAKKALAALGTEKTDDAVIVFGLRRTVAPRTIIGQAGPSGGLVPSAAGDNTFRRARIKRIRKAGAELRRQDVVMRTGAERSWFFFEDQGPHQAFEHPGRVVVVGERTGKVRISELTRWVPLVHGRPAAFFRSAKNYESKRFRVFSRTWAAAADASRARTRQAPTGMRQQVADALAAEKSCALRISDTMGDFFDFGRVDVTRARLGLFFEGLEKLNAGFISRRYTTKSGQTPIQAAQELIDDAGCRDLFLYAAGAAPKDGQAGMVVGMRTAPGGLIEWHVITGDELEALVKKNQAVTFKFLFDVPHSGRVNTQLIDEPNTVLLLSSGGPGEASFTYVPELTGPGGVLQDPGNPDQLLEFTNALLGGLEAFVNSPQEIADWLAFRAAGGPSMMTWMMARAMSLSPAFIFAAPLNLLKFPTRPAPPPPPPPPVGPPPPINHAPNPTTPAQVTPEDTAKAITLTATDADGDPVTFTVTSLPSHGTLTGTPPNLTYTPAQDFHGQDEFAYTAADNRGGSSAGTVKVIVQPDNDASAVTATSGGAISNFVEDGAAVVIDSGLTLSDPDSTQLEGATVKIIDGTFKTGDALVFSNQNGISGSDDGAGTLTLSGVATVTQYRDALRSVQFDSTHQDPGTSRTFEFRAEDGDEAGIPAERDITVEPVNDHPVVATGAAGALSYIENDPGETLFPSATITDVDDTQINGATVQVGTGFVAGDDQLDFTNQNGITGNWAINAGTLTLSGVATVAQYQTAIRSIQYRNNSNDPAASRTISFTVTDGGPVDATSNTAQRQVDATPVNDAPVASASNNPTSYTEGDVPKVVDGSFTLNDPDDTHLEGAVVSITSGFQAGDVLSFVDGGGITHTYSSGVLTLSGSATTSDYQAALRDVKFANTTVDDMTALKTVEFVLDDGALNSAGSTKDIAVTGVNDAPSVHMADGDLVFTEGLSPVSIDSALTLTDPEGDQLSAAR
ncbi:MAG TPA: Ig-like domain-containing protein, partial [Solirubrobacteraceae bacterium]|nr:Ig-like domain-containing protein [Solirubrobacteraceae bacterium]